MIAERVRSELARVRGEGKRLGRPPIAPTLEKRIREALVRVIANSLGSILRQCSASAALFAAASVAAG